MSSIDGNKMGLSFLVARSNDNTSVARSNATETHSDVTPSPSSDRLDVKPFGSARLAHVSVPANSLVLLAGAAASASSASSSSSPSGSEPPTPAPSTPVRPDTRNPSATPWSESSGSTAISNELSTAAAMSNLHVLATGGSGQHVCNMCSSSFAQKLRLLHHLHKVHGSTTYSGKKIIACNRCESAFLRNTDLKKHLACVHEKKRPHKCVQPGCTSRFFFAKDLKKHVSTVHERNKPFSCPKCSQKFGKREHMTSHVRRVHDKLKPFSCTICKVPLASKYNLQGHLRTFSHRQRVDSQRAAEQANAAAAAAVAVVAAAAAANKEQASANNSAMVVVSPNGAHQV